MIRNAKMSSVVFAVSVLAASFDSAAPVNAAIICGFSAQPTLAEELRDSQAAVVVRLIEKARQPPEGSDAEPVASTFEVAEVLQGEDQLARRPDASRPLRLKLCYFGEQPVGSRFLTFGVTQDIGLVWGSPIPLGDDALRYVRELRTLSKTLTERSHFFLKHLQHADELLATDAYDELTKLSYADLAQLRERLPRERLIDWIGDPDVGGGRRRLYVRLLTLCAKPEDVERFEAFVVDPDEQMRPALDAAIFGYLVLSGPRGMPLVEHRYLADPAAEYRDTYSAVMALRNIGTETNAVSKRRLAQGLRHLLGRPEIADLVIGDLARWQDWSAMPRLVELFKTADPKTNFIRVPVLNFLKACPLREAKLQLAVLSQLDPEAAKAAKFFAAQKEEPLEGA